MHVNPRKVATAVLAALVAWILLVLFVIGPGAEAQQDPWQWGTPCPGPTVWVTEIATEIAGTGRQTLLMRPVCATPAPARAPGAAAPAVPAGVVAMAEPPNVKLLFLLFLWALFFLALCAVVALGVRQVRRMRRRRPRTIGETLGIYDTGGQDGEG